MTDHTLDADQYFVDSDPTPKTTTPYSLKYKKVYTLKEEFEHEGVCIAITMLKKGLIKICKQPSDPTMPDQRVKTWIRKLESLRDNQRYSKGVISVKYRRPMLPEGQKKGAMFGRANAVGLSSQTMPRSLRALLFGNLYQDVDMKNAHPTICVSLFPNYTTVLAQYVNNRDDWLTKVMNIHKVSRDDAKTLFLTPLNSKHPIQFYKNWCKVQLDNDDSVIRKALIPDQELNKKYTSLGREIITLRRVVLGRHQEFVFNTDKKTKKKKSKRNKTDHVGTYFNKWLCSQESKAIMVVKYELEAQHAAVHSIIHDGCHKYGHATVDIQKINEALQKQWKLLEVKVKAFDMPTIPPNLVIERRHPFNSCLPASQTDIMTPGDIHEKLHNAAQIVYESEKDIHAAVKAINCDFMNLAFARLSEKKPVIVQRLYGKYVEQNNVHNDGTKKNSSAHLRQRLVEYMPRSKMDATKIFARNFYHSFKYEVEDAEGKKYLKKINIDALSKWYDDISANDYTKCVFNPNIGQLPADHLNRYAGYAVEPSGKSFEECKKLCAPFLSHIHEVWANGEEEHFQYIMAWLSHTVKYPWLKIGIAMVILGEKRCGKGIIIAFLLAIFGQHASEITQGEHATGNFNAALMDKVFISMNESSWGGKQSSLGVMRGMITDPSMQGTRKGIDTETIKNFLDFIFSSNFLHAVCNKLGEQRYYITRCSSKYSAMSKTVSPEDKKAHMDEIAAIPVPIVLKLLLCWKSPDNMNLKVPPFTNAQQEQTEHSMSTTQQYILGCMRGESPQRCVIVPSERTIDANGKKTRIKGHRKDIDIWGNLVDKSIMYEHYTQKFSRRTANATPANDTQFWKNLRAMEAEYGCNLTLGSDKGKDQEIKIEGFEKRVNCVRFPTLEEAKKQFKELCNEGFVI